MVELDRYACGRAAWKTLDTNDDAIAPGTTALALPMRVVSAVSVESGTGLSSDPLLKTTYQYQSLSAFVVPAIK